MSIDDHWLTRPPRLEDAPDWANWLAQDDSGMWCWYALKPALYSMSDNPDSQHYWDVASEDEDLYERLLAENHGNHGRLFKIVGWSLTPLDVSQMLFEVKRPAREP